MSGFFVLCRKQKSIIVPYYGSTPNEIIRILRNVAPGILTSVALDFFFTWQDLHHLAHTPFIHLRQNRLGLQVHIIGTTIITVVIT